MNGLLKSIEKFIYSNQRDQLFEDFIDELKEIVSREPHKNSDLICITKDITLRLSSQGKIRGRQEMDPSSEENIAREQRDKG